MKNVFLCSSLNSKETNVNNIIDVLYKFNINILTMNNFKFMADDPNIEQKIIQVIKNVDFIVLNMDNVDIFALKVLNLASVYGKPIVKVTNNQNYIDANYNIYGVKNTKQLESNLVAKEFNLSPIKIDELVIDNKEPSYQILDLVTNWALAIIPLEQLGQSLRYTIIGNYVVFTIIVDNKIMGRAKIDLSKLKISKNSAVGYFNTLTNYNGDMTLKKIQSNKAI